MELDDDNCSGHASIGFPLGLALLVTLLLLVSCFFCCCLHWDKLRSLFLSSGALLINPHQPQTQEDLTSPHHKAHFPVVMMKQNQAQSLPVLMPGDEVPKFMAVACPCHPPTDERITIQVQKVTE